MTIITKRKLLMGLAAAPLLPAAVVAAPTPSFLAPGHVSADPVMLGPEVIKLKSDAKMWHDILIYHLNRRTEWEYFTKTLMPSGTTFGDMSKAFDAWKAKEGLEARNGGIFLHRIGEP